MLVGKLKVTFGKTLFRLLIHQTPAMIIHRLYVIVLGYMLHSKLTSSLLIYHSFIIDKMSCIINPG